MKTSAESIVKNTRAAAKQLGNNLAVETIAGRKMTVFFVYNPDACTAERTRVGTVGDEDLVAVSTALLAEVARLRGEMPAVRPVEDFSRERTQLACEVKRLRENLSDIRRRERRWTRPLPVVEAQMLRRVGL